MKTDKELARRSSQSPVGSSPESAHPLLASHGSFPPKRSRVASRGEHTDPLDDAPAPHPLFQRTKTAPITSMRRDTPESMTPLDRVSNEEAPHVAVKYGDSIRLFVRNKYSDPQGAPEGPRGGYVGTVDDNSRRFLTSKSASKLMGANSPGESLVALPSPSSDSNDIRYRASSYRIRSTCNQADGTPVSYGDVVVLYDEHDQVWNNKIGVGPSTKNGLFGPRARNTPGEMYLSFYQIDPQDYRTRKNTVTGQNQNGDSGQNASPAITSDEEDEVDDDGYAFFGQLSKSTRNMNISFGPRAQDDLDLEAVRNRTHGKVVYYGDGNVIINVADSNRIRSKFNRIITQARNPADASVRGGGGHLRCDGRGKTLLFEVHGPAPGPIKSAGAIDTSKCEGVHEFVERPVKRKFSIKSNDRVLGRGSLLGRQLWKKKNAVGQTVEVIDLLETETVSMHFDDRSLLRVSAKALIDSLGQPFYVVARKGPRPVRVQIQAKRTKHRIADLKSTFKDTYKDLFRLFSAVVIACSAILLIFSRFLSGGVLKPAVYMGLTTTLGLFAIEVVSPGRIIQTHTTGSSESGDSPSTGDWDVTVLSQEPSCTERLSLEEESGDGKLKEKIIVPKGFLVAEDMDAAKALERYKATLAWRKEVDADALLSTPQPTYWEIKAEYKHFLHKTDKLGHPVYYQKVGSLDLKQLEKEGIDFDDVFNHYLFAMEFAIKYAASELCECESCAPSEQQKMVVVLDARGVGMKDLSGDAFDFMRRTTSVLQKHYPQRSFKIFIVNVPSWFGMAWKAIKPLLNERTRAKTNIVNENDTPAALLDAIDAENIPEEYGGSCACPGGCEHSAFQLQQERLVEAVMKGETLDDKEPSESPTCDKSVSGSVETASADSDSQLQTQSPQLQPTAKNLDELSAVSLDLDSESLARSMPPDSFREEVVMAGYLLKRALKHKHFNPIWYRRFFILHPTSLRFGKSMESPIFQIVSFTPDTVVRKTHKHNFSFEVVTPLLANSGDGLVLYAPNAKLLDDWINALTNVITNLKEEHERLRHENSGRVQLERKVSESSAIGVSSYSANGTQ